MKDPKKDLDRFIYQREINSKSNQIIRGKNINDNINLYKFSKPKLNKFNIQSNQNVML